MIFPDKVYDVLKWIALVVLPGLGALYAALAQLWGWPYIDEVPGTLLAICAFLGALTGMRSVLFSRRAVQNSLAGQRSQRGTPLGRHTVAPSSIIA